LNYGLGFPATPQAAGVADRTNTSAGFFLDFSQVEALGGSMRMQLKLIW